jgi:hypothetical protein
MPFQGSPPSVSVSGWERGRYQINIQFHNVSRASLCRKDNAAAAGSPGHSGQTFSLAAGGGQPAGWIDLTDMNWIGRSISAFGPCGTSPTNCMASPGSST